MDKKKAKILIPSAVLILILLGGIIFLCTYKAQIWENVTYELGTALETDINYYVKGTSIALKKGVIDLSAVDNMTVGSYKATVSFKRKVFTYNIFIEDTTPPVIELVASPEEINIGITYPLSTVFKNATDLSGPVETTISVDGRECRSFYFDTVSAYEVTISAKDINNNLTVKKLTINAVDTIAPTITGYKDYPFFAIGEPYGLNDFVKKISDNSGSYSTAITLNQQPVEGDVVFTECGEQNIVVTASDAEGNAESLSFVISSDYRPEIYGVSEKTVKKGTTFDLCEGVLGWDQTEGFLTGNIVVLGIVNFDKEGTYPVTYTLKDENGLKAEVRTNIHVDSKNYSMGTPEYPDDLLDKLLAADSFQYKLLDTPDQEEAAILMYPCQVSLRSKKSSGSGFIYKIDKDYIYIGTMGHCINNTTKDGLSMWFYNPTYDSMQSHKSTKRCLDDLKVDTYEKIYTKGDDRAMYRISIDQIPKDMLIYLKEVNKTNESNNSIENGIYTDTIYVAKDMYTGRFKKSFTLFNKGGSDYEYLLNYFSQYKNNEIWLLTNETGVAGQSGSLLYDGYGNPLASLSGKMTYKSSIIGRHVYFKHFRELYDKLSAQ